MPTNAELSELKRHSIPAHFIETAIHWALRLSKLKLKADDNQVASLSFEEGTVANDDDREEYRWDLAAVGMLANWEEAGIRTHVDAGLPTAQQATDTLTEKRRRRDRSTVRPIAISTDWSGAPTGYVVEVDTNSLWHRVAIFAVEHFASSAHDFFATDIPIEGCNEDALIDEFATFLWRHRHDLPPDGETIVERLE